MQIANRLRTDSRAEYLLYLWQVEDIIRAYGADFDRLRRDYLSRFDLRADERRDTERWYESLCEMMHTEGVMQSGHLSLSRAVMQDLEDLHQRLLSSTRFPHYREMYYKVLPYIVELRGKGAGHEASELQTCLEALYGVMLLRLAQRELSAATEAAMKDIATLLAALSDYYRKDQEEPIDLD